MSCESPCHPVSEWPVKRDAHSTSTAVYTGRNCQCSDDRVPNCTVIRGELLVKSVAPVCNVRPLQVMTGPTGEESGPPPHILTGWRSRSIFLTCPPSFSHLRYLLLTWLFSHVVERSRKWSLREAGDDMQEATPNQSLMVGAANPPWQQDGTKLYLWHASSEASEAPFLLRSSSFAPLLPEGRDQRGPCHVFGHKASLNPVNTDVVLPLTRCGTLI